MSEPSSTGVRLLSAFPRALANISADPILAPGLSVQSIPVPAMILPARGLPNDWQLVRNFVYRFSAGIQVTSAGPTEVSIESAGMQLQTFGNPLPPSSLGCTLINAARFSNLTALAQDCAISFDEWEIDTNDLLQLGGVNCSVFRLSLFVTFNNTGAAPKGSTITGYAKASAAQFDNYRFDKWE